MEPYPTTNIHSAPDDFQVIDMGEDEYDPPIILGRPFLNTIKVIIYIGTGEVHMHFPSEGDATETRGGKSSRTDG